MKTKYFTSIMFLFLFLLYPLAALAEQVVEVTESVPDPLQKVGFLAGVCSFLVMLVGQLLKSPMFGEWMKTVAPRKRILVPLVLSLVAAGAGAYLYDMPFVEAIASILATFGGSVVLHEGVVSSALGKTTGTKEETPVSSDNA